MTSVSTLRMASDRASIGDAPQLSLAEILSALSFALDLTEGAIPGHAVRTTLLGMRIARAMQLGSVNLSALYYALQLKDVGCSSNAARMSQIFGGDDRAAKAMTKTSDWSGLFAAMSLKGDRSTRLQDLSAGLRAVPISARALWTTVLPGSGFRAKIRHIVELNKNTEANTRELIALRCDRGAAILEKLDLSELACTSVRHLDEHWDGTGYPDGLRAEQIPVLARVMALAQNLDVFSVAFGTREAIAMLKRRSGTWFDPQVVQAAVLLDGEGGLWEGCGPYALAEVTRQRVIDEAPDIPENLHADQIETICEAFADVVDAKSPFTFRHSLRVAEVARSLATELQMPDIKRELLGRAGLLHDLGKLGVSNSILDKPGKLSGEEMRLVWLHPTHGRTILARIAGFESIAQLAGEHHEKLDGSGYPNALTAQQLSLESRLLTMADCFTALVEHRPYRTGSSFDEALTLLKQEVGSRLDAYVFEGLESLVQRWRSAMPSLFHASLG